MSDLADTIDDLICSFEADGKTMDTLIMYLFCWALVGFAVLAAGKFAYGRVVAYQSDRECAAAKSAVVEPAMAAAGRKPAAARSQQLGRGPGAVPPTPPLSRKRLGSKTGRTSAAVAGIAAGLSAVPAAAAANKAFSSSHEHAPHQQHHNRPRTLCKATGNDPDAVRWTDNVFAWLYEYEAVGEPPVLEHLSSEWIRSLNEYTKKSFTEVS